MHKHIIIKFVPQGPGSTAERGVGQGYTYFNHEPEIAVGDFAIVMLGEKLRLVEVVECSPPEGACKKATKWIVQKIDMDKYNALTAMSPPVEEKPKKLTRLKKIKSYTWSDDLL